MAFKNASDKIDLAVKEKRKKSETISVQRKLMRLYNKFLRRIILILLKFYKPNYDNRVWCTLRKFLILS